MVESIVQGVIVVAIVGAALVHASTKYLPAAWRRRIADVLSSHGKRPSKLASWYAPTAGCGDGCSNCSSPDGADKAAGACGTPAHQDQAHEHVIKLHARPRA
jgi:hypothetical protein